MAVCKQVADLYKETCAARHQAGPSDLQLLHAFRRYQGAGRRARARQIRYYQECVIPAFPGDPQDGAAELSLFHRHGRAAAGREARRFDRELGAARLAARITETLKKVEAAGFDEVILYFNVGLKPHAQVKEEMARFMAEVAPAFAAARQEHAA